MSGVILTVASLSAQSDAVIYGIGTEVSETMLKGTNDLKAGVEKTSADKELSVLSGEAERAIWVTRYLSVCYPLRRMRITSPYGYRKDPFTGKRKFHNGIDLYARGDEVFAMMEGTVLKVGQDMTSGKYVVLRHGEFTVSYCHLSRILVSKGTTVRPRDAVGITGSTGRSTGEHLHITCRRNGEYVDPAEILNYIKAMRERCVAALAEMSQDV